MSLPIRSLTLYKHGLAHLERAGTVSGDQLELRFPTAAMDDVLKSLVILDEAGGIVHGVDVERAEDRGQRLEEEPLQLSQHASFLDLLRDLRGHHVTVKRLEGGSVAGTVIGIDVEDDDPLKRALLSVLTDGIPGTVVPIPVASINDVQLASDADADVRRVLQTWRGQDRQRSATVRLSPGTHELRVAHLTPASTWRVSYRLVVEAPTGESGDPRILLQAWGLFDNTFDEDLTDVAVTLVAGMPVSFRYRLYEGQIPHRPEMADESRTMASAVEFDAMAQPVAAMMAAPAPGAHIPRRQRAQAKMAESSARFVADDMDQDFAPTATGESRGSLFAYVVPEPVSAKRGRSVLVPLISQFISGTRELLYKGGSANNGNPPSPIASLRLKNSTGLTLERGPVTVLEYGGYGGEAVVAFSPPDAGFVVPYAVELGVTVRETHNSESFVNTLSIKQRYLLVEETVVTTSSYIVTNKLATDTTITVEHRLTDGWELHETPVPLETGGGAARWNVACLPTKETTIVIKERCLTQRWESISGLDEDRLRTYLHDKRLSEALHDGLASVLAQYRTIAHIDDQRSELEQERAALHQRQEQARQNLGSLHTSGDEGTLRQRFVTVMAEAQDRLGVLDETENSLTRRRTDLEEQINAELDRLATP